MKSLKIILGILMILFTYFFITWCINNGNYSIIIIAIIPIMVAVCLIFSPAADYISEKISNIG